MYNNKIFQKGVHSVLIGHWKLSCETPLVIRNGVKINYTSRNVAKTRNKDINISWTSKDPKKSDQHELAALHYGYEIENSKVVSYHFVPPSSVRGALRSWTINHLVQHEFRSNMTPPKIKDNKNEKEDTEKYIKSMKNALANSETGYPFLASLFGLAFDTRGEVDFEGNAGRLRLETEKFSTYSPRPITINGNLRDGRVGPLNAARQMTVRNPLDRITHASQEGGLHHFLEFSKGETFIIKLTILNPEESDLGLISYWVRELNAGFLRIGALSSIGRGRVSVQEQSYQLCKMPGPSDWMYFTAGEKASSDEALAGFWQAYNLSQPESNLAAFEPALEKEIGGNHAGA